MKEDQRERMHTHLLSEDYHALPMESPGARNVPSSSPLTREESAGIRRRAGSMGNHEDQQRELQQFGVTFGTKGAMSWSTRSGAQSPTSTYIS